MAADSATPVRVKRPNGEGYLTGVEQVAAGSRHSLALKKDGTVWAWGSSLGNGDALGTGTYGPAPRQVSGLTGVEQVAAGSNHSLAVAALQ